MPERTLEPQTDGPFTGMHHDTGLVLGPGRSLYLQNVFAHDGRLLGRSGLNQLGSQLVDSSVQGLYHFEELDGTIHIVAICNGDLYEYDDGTDSWSVTDLAAEGLTISSSAKVDFANSRGRLIVTDGVNTPFMWDGSTFTELTAAPIAEGVTVYYDKVFFFAIPSQRNSFEWSEEGDPTTGYDAKGFSWEFAQTDAGRVVALAALNELFNVLKQDSISSVRGAVNQNFQTDAVREGVSETEGLIGRRGVTILDGNPYFVSQRGPRAAVGGQRFTRLDDDDQRNNRLAETWEQVSRSTWDEVIAVVEPNRRQVWWALPSDDLVLVYGVDHDAWSVFTFPFTVEAMAQAEFPSSEERVLIGDGSGNVYAYGDESVLSDDGASIPRKIRSRLYGAGNRAMVNRLVESRMIFEVGNGGLTFEVRPVVEGEVKTNHGKMARFADAGRQRYRRGFNAVGTALGWEIYQDETGETLELEETTTLLTAVGSNASRGY